MTAVQRALVAALVGLITVATIAAIGPFIDETYRQITTEVGR